MTREEALELVLSAADNWASELVEWIAPASDQFDMDEEAEEERNLADEIWEAIELLRKEEHSNAKSPTTNLMDGGREPLH